METDKTQAVKTPTIQLPNQMEEVIKTLPKEKQEILIAGFTQIQSFSGPIPPPNVLQGYEDVLKGSAERILSMAEKQSNHRIEMESTVVKRGLNQKSWGVAIGGIALFVILGMVTGFALLGLLWLAGILATTTLLIVLCVFVLGKEPSDRKKKTPQQAPAKQKKK